MPAILEPSLGAVHWCLRADSSDSTSVSAPVAHDEHAAQADGHAAAGSWADPGWCFVCAGLLLVAVAVLVPAWRDVAGLKQQVAELDAQIERAHARERNGRELLEALRIGDALTEQRLIAWQWNLVPLGDEAIIHERHDGGIAGWVEARTGAPNVPAVAPPPTRLERWTGHGARPWLLGGGGLCLLVGIVAMPLPERRRLPGS